MSIKVLFVGMVIGVVGLFVVFSMTGVGSVNATAVCDSRFDGNWTGQQVDSNFGNQSVTLECTNGTATQEITVRMDVETEADS